MNAWDVWLDGFYLDTVYYTKDCDRRYVLRSLIYHDGYNERIKVVCTATKH